MDEVTTIDARADDPEDYKAVVTEYLSQVDQIRGQMAADQQEIDRLKRETREILARLEAA